MLIGFWDVVDAQKRTIKKTAAYHEDINVM